MKQRQGRDRDKVCPPTLLEKAVGETKTEALHDKVDTLVRHLCETEVLHEHLSRIVSDHEKEMTTYDGIHRQIMAIDPLAVMPIEVKERKYFTLGVLSDILALVSRNRALLAQSLYSTLMDLYRTPANFRVTDIPHQILGSGGTARILDLIKAAASGESCLRETAAGRLAAIRAVRS